MDNYINKYFGPYKITSAKLSKLKTYLGKPMADIVMDGTLKKTIPVKALDAAVRDATSDLSELRTARITPVVEELMVVLAESDLSKEDLQHAVSFTLLESLKQAYNRGDAVLWGKEEYEVSLMDVNRVLTAKK
jgi:hypothetical protein